MSEEFCKDCGVFIAPNTQICPVCEFCNESVKLPEYFMGWDTMNTFTGLSDGYVPEYHPGY